MIDLFHIAQVEAPEIDYEGLSPLFALAGGAVIVLLTSLFRARFVQRVLVPLLTLVALGAALGLTIWQWETGDLEPIIENALAVDTLALGAGLLFYVAAILTVLLSLRAEAAAVAGRGEYYALLLSSVAGMVVLAAAENLVTLFVGLELLSIPLYALCASELRRATSLESGLKYLIVGSLGSATLLYGLAMLYGATGATDFDAIFDAVGDEVGLDDPLLLIGIALAMVGLAFKASVAPFHQWSPDVYQGAPTPVTAFMATATKVAAFTVIVRLFEHALWFEQTNWAPALAALATVSIIIGNVGALRQRSLKRLLAWSGVAQAGYILAGVVVGTELGVRATWFYLATYLLMNVAAFAVVIARERVSEAGDDLKSFEGLGQASPLLAWPMTIAMLALAGFPATAGFIGKFYLIDATVAGDYAWLGILIVVGSMISLAYYLRVIAVMWMGGVEVELPTGRKVRPVGGWSPEADARAQPEVTAVALLCGAATIFFGIVPSPLFDLARDVGTSLSHLV
ncbi:MAG TPA: NADH-quinone oxidoreductase subunit N [Thermoleophilaceae bacterium]|nr:NADH-quinone oxidoreductase subunit N [Thermoleophilaceae bacterium]